MENKTLRKRVHFSIQFLKNCKFLENLTKPNLAANLELCSEVLEYFASLADELCEDTSPNEFFLRDEPLIDEELQSIIRKLYDFLEDVSVEIDKDLPSWPLMFVRAQTFSSILRARLSEDDF